MSWIAVATIGSTLIGAGAASSAAKSQEAAGREQIASSERSAADQLALQREVFESTTQNFAPFVGGGTDAFNALLSTQGLGPRPEGFEGLSFSPGAQFALEQGRDTIEAGAAGRGNLFSGASLKALETLRGGIATQDRENQLNRLAQLSGFGQASAGQQAIAGQNLAVGGSNTLGQQQGFTSNALANIGNAQSAGAIGVGNAFQSGINNALQLGVFGQQSQNNAFQ